MSCAPLLKACNYQVDVVNKSHCGLATVPDDILRYGRSVDEILLDSNQIRDLPKVRTTGDLRRDQCYFSFVINFSFYKFFH